MAFKRNSSSKSQHKVFKNSKVFSRISPNYPTIDLNDEESNFDTWDNLDDADGNTTSRGPDDPNAKKEKNLGRMPGGKAKTEKPAKAVSKPATLLRSGTFGSTSLWDCKTITEVDAHLSASFVAFRRKALYGVKGRKLSDDTRNTIGKVINGQATDVPSLISEKACTTAHQHIHRGLVALLAGQTDVEVVFVTVISGDGATSSDAPVIDAHGERARGQRIARLISPDFIGVAEWVLFNSHRHPNGGRVMQGHSHFLAFGPGVLAKANAVAAKHSASIPPNITDAPPIVVRPVRIDDVNLARMASYHFEAPHKGKTWCPERGDKKGHMQHSEKPDRAILFFRMAQIRSMIPIDAVLFAGGKCKAIRSDLRTLLNATGKSDVPTPDRLLAPDTIGAFWVEVNRELRKVRWRLPVIVTRP